jgi:hypothetical protein
MRPNSNRDIAFFVAWMLTIQISVIDGYLVWHCASVIGEVELNPLGRWLLFLGNGNVWVFLLSKSIGTILVCMILLKLYRHNPKLGLAASVPIASFQVGLLVFLMLN